jgi:hypothetical protein
MDVHMADGDVGGRDVGRRRRRQQRGVAGHSEWQARGDVVVLCARPTVERRPVIYPRGCHVILDELFHCICSWQHQPQR